MLIKYIPQSWYSSLIGGAGGIALSQSVTFGWPHGSRLSDPRAVEAVCVFLCGFGLILISGFVRQAILRISELEGEVKRLKSEDGQR
jgi:hypothetical protein